MADFCDLALTITRITAKEIGAILPQRGEFSGRLARQPKALLDKHTGRADQVV